MNEQNSQIEIERIQRAVFAAILTNLMSTERDLSHDEVKFTICNAIGKMIGEDELVRHDFVEFTLVQFCQSFAQQHNALVEVNRILEGE